MNNRWPIYIEGKTMEIASSFFFAKVCFSGRLMANVSLNKKIHEMKQPILFLFRHKKRLQELGRDILELQEKFLEWDKKAGNFIIKPHLIFSENDEREIGFVHFTAVLRDIRSKFDNQMIMIATNFNELQHGHSNQVNFIIAVASFALTYVGLILALLTIKYN